MDIRLLSVGVALFGIGAGVLRGRKMKPRVQKVFDWGGGFLIALGIGVVLYSVIAGGETGAQKPPVTIEQTNPHNSPPVVGDGNTVTINPDVNPNAPVR